ncbi:asparagine synthase-related protein [Nocardia sp. NPDC051570]|uniref:asparagine synthase-related protein n=1 Tax=Nocardia sp. NPDC051570 TaxID=3364324 RepID=UPI0037BD1A73
MYALTTSLVVLPDSSGGVRAGRQVPHHDPEIVTHSSGRPWLIGQWAPENLVVAEAGGVRIAVFGHCPMSSERLTAFAARIRTPSDVDSLARILPGSAHLIASIHGRVRFQGTLTGSRQVFSARLEQIPIAADRADVLAAMIGAELDEDMLAVNIACQQLIPPLSERSWWRGVQRVAPDSYLVLDDTGARPVRWWSPPEPTLTLAEGAPEVREALREAVAWRRPAQGRLSADLSGGMDSTSLCFLAAEHTPDLLVFRRTEGSAINDDPHYAGEAARLLTRAEHIELRDDDGPTVFAPPYSLPDTEAPHALVRGINTIRNQIQRLVRHGTTLHLAGHGGDELFTGSAVYLHSLLWRQPVTAWQDLRVHRALGRWPLLPTLAALCRSGDLNSWWRHSADHLTDPPQPPNAPKLDWAYPLRVTPWATADAVGTARRVLRDVAEQAVPLARDRGQHEALTYLRFAGPLFRQLCRDYAEGGLRLDLPYLDDRVVEAALMVRPAERYSPWRYKPLLAEAMRTHVPDFILDRRTKGDYEEEVDHALHHHLPDLLDLFEDSALAARGLIDVDALRTSLYTPTGGEQDDPAPNLEMTLGCEMWLRHVAQPRQARAEERL